MAQINLLSLIIPTSFESHGSGSFRGGEESVAGGVSRLRQLQPLARHERVEVLEDEAPELVLVGGGVGVRHLAQEVMERAILPGRLALQFLR